MAKSERLPEGVLMLVQRHAAVAGTETGLNAINSMKKISNVDPSEGVWQKGDEFEIAPEDQIAEAAFVAMVNGNKAPAIAVHCTNGQDKVLYLSTLKKNVVVYHETEDGYETVKKADGTAETHFADTPLRKEVMSKATVGDIVTSLAGRKFKVADVLGPYKTSRLKATYGDNGQRTGYEVVGLRNTTIPVFEEIQ